MVPLTGALLFIGALTGVVPMRAVSGFPFKVIISFSSSCRGSLSCAGVDHFCCYSFLSSIEKENGDYFVEVGVTFLLPFDLPSVVVILDDTITFVGVFELF